MKILGVLILIAGLILFWQYQYIPALISILIGAVFLGMPKKPVSDDNSSDDTPVDGEIVRVVSQLKKVRAVSTEHRRLAFPVVGADKNNDDGSFSVRSATEKIWLSWRFGWMITFFMAGSRSAS